MKLNFLKKNRDLSDITEEEMYKILNDIPETILLDVRSTQEYNEGHIRNAINLPVYDLEKKAYSVLKNKNDIIIVYCNAGIRSKKAIKILKNKGYNNLYNVKDGIRLL